jgi:general secretion pathway protein D
LPPPSSSANYENANNLPPILRPLISPNNTINVNPATTRW